MSEALRRPLKQLHNGNDIIIQVGHLNRKHLSDPGYWSSYNDLLLESKFQLVPRGLGLHSHDCWKVYVLDQYLYCYQMVMFCHLIQSQYHGKKQL